MESHDPAGTGIGWRYIERTHVLLYREVGEFRSELPTLRVCGDLYCVCCMYLSGAGEGGPAVAGLYYDGSGVCFVGGDVGIVVFWGGVWVEPSNSSQSCLVSALKLGDRQIRRREDASGGASPKWRATFGKRGACTGRQVVLAVYWYLFLSVGPTSVSRCFLCFASRERSDARLSFGLCLVFGAHERQACCIASLSTFRVSRYGWCSHRYVPRLCFVDVFGAAVGLFPVSTGR